MADTTVTTTSITAVSESTRIAQDAVRLPALNQVNSSVVRAWPPGDVEEDDDGQHHREQQRTAGHHLSQAVADLAAEEASDEGAQQRQEDDGDVDHGPSPSSR